MSASAQASWAARIGHSIKDVRARAVESFLQKYQNNFMTIDSIASDGELVLSLIEWFNNGDARQADMLAVIDDLARNSSGVLCLSASGALVYFTQYRAYAPANLLQAVDSIIARLKSSPSQPAPALAPMRAGDWANSDIGADLSAASKQARELVREMAPNESFRFPAVSLSRSELQMLYDCDLKLQSTDSATVIATLFHLRNTIFPSIPCQVLLQRPETLRSILQLMHPSDTTATITSNVLQILVLLANLLNSAALETTSCFPPSSSSSQSISNPTATFSTHSSNPIALPEPGSVPLAYCAHTVIMRALPLLRVKSLLGLTCQVILAWMPFAVEAAGTPNVIGRIQSRIREWFSGILAAIQHHSSSSFSLSAVASIAMSSKFTYCGLLNFCCDCALTISTTNFEHLPHGLVDLLSQASLDSYISEHHPLLHGRLRSIACVADVSLSATIENIPAIATSCTFMQALTSRHPQHMKTADALLMLDQCQPHIAGLLYSPDLSVPGAAVALIVRCLQSRLTEFQLATACNLMVSLLLLPRFEAVSAVLRSCSQLLESSSAIASILLKPRVFPSLITECVLHSNTEIGSAACAVVSALLGADKNSCSAAMLKMPILIVACAGKFPAAVAWVDAIMLQTDPLTRLRINSACLISSSALLRHRASFALRSVSTMDTAQYADVAVDASKASRAETILNTDDAHRFASVALQRDGEVTIRMAVLEQLSRAKLQPETVAVLVKAGLLSFLLEQCAVKDSPLRASSLSALRALCSNFDVRDALASDEYFPFLIDGCFHARPDTRRNCLESIQLILLDHLSLFGTELSTPVPLQQLRSHHTLTLPSCIKGLFVSILQIEYTSSTQITHPTGLMTFDPRIAKALSPSGENASLTAQAIFAVLKGDVSSARTHADFAHNFSVLCSVAILDGDILAQLCALPSFDSLGPVFSRPPATTQDAELLSSVCKRCEGLLAAIQNNCSDLELSCIAKKMAPFVIKLLRVFQPGPSEAETDAKALVSAQHSLLELIVQILESDARAVMFHATLTLASSSTCVRILFQLASCDSDPSVSLLAIRSLCFMYSPSFPRDSSDSGMSISEVTKNVGTLHNYVLNSGSAVAGYSLRCIRFIIDRFPSVLDQSTFPFGLLTWCQSSGQKLTSRFVRLEIALLLCNFTLCVAMSARHQLLSHVKECCVSMLHFAFNPSEDSFIRSAGVATIAAILSQTSHLFRDDASSVSSAAGKLSEVSNLASQHLGLMLHDGIVAVGGYDAIGKMLHSALGAASSNQLSHPPSLAAGFCQLLMAFAGPRIPELHDFLHSVGGRYVLDDVVLALDVKRSWKSQWLIDSFVRRQAAALVPSAKGGYVKPGVQVWIAVHGCYALALASTAAQMLLRLASESCDELLTSAPVVSSALSCLGWAPGSASLPVKALNEVLVDDSGSIVNAVQKILAPYMGTWCAPTAIARLHAAEVQAKAVVCALLSYLVSKSSIDLTPHFEGPPSVFVILRQCFGHHSHQPLLESACSCLHVCIEAMSAKGHQISLDVDGVGDSLARELSKLFSSSISGDGRGNEAGRQQLYALCLGSVIGSSDAAKSEALQGGKDSSLISVSLSCLFDSVAQLSVLDLATHLKASRGTPFDINRLTNLVTLLKLCSRGSNSASIKAAICTPALLKTFSKLLPIVFNLAHSGYDLALSQVAGFIANICHDSSVGQGLVTSVKGPCTPISVYIIKAALSNDACARNTMLFDDIMHVGVVAACCPEGRAAIAKASICEVAAVALGRWSPKRQWGLCLSILKLLLSLSFHPDGQAAISKCEGVVRAILNCSDDVFTLTGNAHGQVYAHCLFVIRNIAFIPHGKAHFLASNMPTEMVLRGLSSSDSNAKCSTTSDHICTVARLASSTAASALYRNQKLLAQWRGSTVNSKLAERVATLGEQCEGAIALQLLAQGPADSST